MLCTYSFSTYLPRTSGLPIPVTDAPRLLALLTNFHYVLIVTMSVLYLIFVIQTASYIVDYISDNENMSTFVIIVFVVI